MSLRDTIGNQQWLIANEDKLKALLPATWTHIENLEGVKIGFGLKLLGVDWRSPEEFGKVMVFLEKVGIMQRKNEYQVRANHLKVFPSSWYRTGSTNSPMRNLSLSQFSSN